MTSDTIEESGVKVFISAMAPATGRARLFFESIPADANEPELISWTQSGQENGNDVLRNDAVTIPPVARRNPAAGFHPAFWPDCVRGASPAFDGFETAESPAAFRQPFLNAKRRY
jgi:hypothetical protein